MEAEHEELSINPFFVALLNKPDLVQQIAREQALVCVPSRDSLKLCSLNLDFLSTHILVPSSSSSTDGAPSSDGAYRTLNGKSVRFSDGAVVCRAGFPRPRTVMVLHDELFYDDDFNTIKVLRTNFPLEGKIPLNYYKAVANQASVDVHTLNARTLTEHQVVLYKLSTGGTSTASSSSTSSSSSSAQLLLRLSSCSPEQALANLGASPTPALDPLPALPPVFSSLTRFIVSFNRAYVLVKGFTDHAGSKVREAVERIKGELTAVAEGAGSGGGGSGGATTKMSRVSSMEASAAIEACIFAGIHRKLWAGLVDLYRAEDARSSSLLSKLYDAGTSMQALGVRPELVCQPVLAVQHLQQVLNGVFTLTPLQKLCVLEDTNKLLTQAVDAQLAQAKSSGATNQDVTLAADDMIPFWIYLIIQARPEALHANCVFMREFMDASNSSFFNTQQLKVHLANLEGALQFVDSGQIGGGGGGGGGMAGPDGVPAPRRTRATSTIVTNSFADLTVRDSPHSYHHGGGGGNPFARTPAGTSSAAAASAFSTRREQSAAQMLAAIEDDYAQLQETLQQQQQHQQPSHGRLAISAHTSRSNSPHSQRSLTQTHASSHTRQGSLQFSGGQTIRSELPATRSLHSSRQSATPSAAVAAVAASSVDRMGQFLAGLERQDDGATGRLVPGAPGPMAGMRAEPAAAAVAARQQQPQQQQPVTKRPLTSYSRHTLPTPVGGVLRLDDEDLPPLIVQRTSAAAQQSTRRF